MRNLKMLKVNYLQFFLLWILVLFSTEDCTGNQIFCDNTTFIGKEPTKLQSSYYRPCGDTANVCFFIPSKSQKICNSSSASYSFNFSSDMSCNYNQSALSPCELHLDGIKCRHNKLSICYSENLYRCSLTISVFVTIGNAVLKQFILEMPQLSIYVEKTFFKVSELQLKVESKKAIQFSWSWPRCTYLDYIFRWTFWPTGSSVPREIREALSLGHDEFKGYKREITNLDPFTMYTICIQSRVDELLSSFVNGPCKAARTPEEPPSRAPEVLSLHPISAPKSKWNCLVNWKNVNRKYWNGNIKAFTINLYKKEDMHKPTTFSVPLNNSSYTIHSLDVKTEYIVRLKLCNGAGCIRSKKHFIAWKGNDDAGNFPWLTVLILSICFVVIVSLVPFIVVFKKRRKRVRARTASIEGLVTPNTADSEYNSEALYEEIPDNEVYDRIEDVPRPPPPPENASIEDQNMRQNLQNERGHFSSPCCSTQEPPYRTICDCGDHIESFHPAGACKTVPQKIVIIDSKRLFNSINQMESSEDDRSQCESYELDSSPSVSSVSSENVPLVHPTSRPFEDSKT